MRGTFRKKPVEIEAWQVNFLNYDEMCDILGWCSGRAVDHDGHLIAIDTLEGTMYADHGDWIIKGVKGEFYPCKPDIFEATYSHGTGRFAADDSIPTPSLHGFDVDALHDLIGEDFQAPAFNDSCSTCQWQSVWSAQVMRFLMSLSDNFDLPAPCGCGDPTCRGCHSDAHYDNASS